MHGPREVHEAALSSPARGTGSGTGAEPLQFVSTLISISSMGTTSSTLQESSSSTPPFQLIFEKALKEYEKKTGKDLTSHPLAAEINGCASSEDILTILEAKAKELDKSQNGDERLTKWLKPTVNILHALSPTLGQAAGMVSYNIYLRYLPVP